VLWVMNRGRKWLFWRGSFLEIGCLLVFQGLYVALFGVRSTFAIALLMLTASCAHLVAHSCVAALGFARLRDGVH
jgi:hypothetical protein